MMRLAVSFAVGGVSLVVTVADGDTVVALAPADDIVGVAVAAGAEEVERGEVVVEMAHFFSMEMVALFSGPGGEGEAAFLFLFMAVDGQPDEKEENKGDEEDDWRFQVAGGVFPVKLRENEEGAIIILF